MLRALIYASVASMALVSCRRGQPHDEPSIRPAEKGIKVETVVASERVVPKTLVLTGVLAGDQRTELAANASGRVLRTFVERGDHVKAGAVCVRWASRASKRSSRPTEIDYAPS
ncbi:MAG TPA: hypothetical protein VK550_06515 [Polyangiaceae bacterium]|nr:hypothetical protein [Polyangiaceae bacterium]